MTADRLRQALDLYAGSRQSRFNRLWIQAMNDIELAARRWLDLQPEECGTCIATPGTVDVETGFADCLTCHGSGHVYKTETVERIEQALKRRAGLSTLVTRGDAVAILDALNEADPPGKET